MSEPGGIEALHPILQHHIVNSLGWPDLRPLQRDTIEPIYAGADVLAIAPTAGGKTESAIFPVLSQILTEQRRGLSTLYICPLRALLNNLHVRLSEYGAYCGVRVGLWHGDVGSAPRRHILDDPPEILLTTPESIEAMLISRKTDHRSLFANLRSVVIDEVHAFGGDDRGWHLLGVLERLSAIAGRDIQRIGLSATVGDPAALLDWLAGGNTGPRAVVAPDVGAGPVEAEITLDYVGNLMNAAKVIAMMHQGEKRLVFCESRASVEMLARLLHEFDVTTYVSHASLALDERRRAEEAFAEARDCVIVSTSTLELGIDVGDLDRVIQINPPATVASFLQRLGRTGRRSGSTRNMMILTTGEKDGVEVWRAAALLSLWRQGFVEPVAPPPLPLHLLAHQLLAYCLQEGQVGRRLWQDVIGRLPEYRDAIERGDDEVIVDWLVAEGFLFDDNGMLSLGPEAERSFGFRHFIELTSSFTSPPVFVARHGSNEIGYLDPMALLTRERHFATVLLAGRAWKITSIDWDRRFVWLEPSDQEGRSRWAGGGGCLSLEMARAMRSVAGGSLPETVEITGRAGARLADLQASMRWVRDGHTSLIEEDRKTTWWTWGGDRANASLVDALSTQVESRGTGMYINLARGAANYSVLREALSDLHPEALPTPEIAYDYADNLKFAECLPTALAIEVARRRLVDPVGVASVLGELRGD